jgi:hypothetical protein
MHNVNFPPDKGKPKRGILNKKKECLSNLLKEQGEKYKFVRIKTPQEKRQKSGFFSAYNRIETTTFSTAGQLFPNIDML